MKQKFFFHDKNSSKIELPGNKIYDFKEVYIKTFNLEDIYQVSTIGIQQDLNRLINFIQDHLSIDINKITEADFKYVLFWERLNSYSYNPIILKWNCGSCFEDNNTEINETNCGYKELSKEYTKDGVNIELYSGDKVNWKIPTIGDSKAAKEFIEKAKKAESSYIIAEIAQCITFLDSPELSLGDKFNKVKQLKPDDFTIFSYLTNEFTNYGIEEIADVKCGHCGGCQQTRFHFELSNLFPNFHDSGLIRSRIFSNSVSNEPSEHTPGGDEQTALSEEEIRREDKDRTAKKQPKKVSDRQDENKEELMTLDEFENKG